MRRARRPWRANVGIRCVCMDLRGTGVTVRGTGRMVIRPYPVAAVSGDEAASLHRWGRINIRPRRLRRAPRPRRANARIRGICMDLRGTGVSVCDTGRMVIGPYPVASIRGGRTDVVAPVGANKYSPAVIATGTAASARERGYSWCLHGIARNWRHGVRHRANGYSPLPCGCHSRG